jgi:hypothetical protein
MGGASGHLQHVNEDLSLTFKDIGEILTLASQGKLENVTEKFDGQNLNFTWDGEVKLARSKGDIKSGGMNVEALKARVGHLPQNVQDAFNTALKIIDKSTSVIPNEIKESIFKDESGNNVWYPFEVGPHEVV